MERRGSKIILWDSKDKNRSRVHTWKAIKLNKLWVGTDTHVSNVLLIESLKQGLVPEFKGYSIAAKEAEISMGARVDFLLHKSGENCWVEVKSSFVVNRGIAQFPDSISPRSLSQIKHLERKARSGDRAVVVFVVQREDADSFKVNSDVFPEYARALRRAQESGVEVLALKYAVTSKGYAVPRKLEVINEIRGRIFSV